MKLTKNSYDILTQLVECRMLTITQLSAFSLRSRQVVRRNIRNLISKDLISFKEQGYGQGPGRPEKIIFLTEKGFGLLKNEGFLSDRAILGVKIPSKNHLVDHQLLTNWFHLHLRHMTKVVPQLYATFLYANTYALKENSNVSLKEQVEIEAGLKKPVKFYPDGVFSLTYKGNNNPKSLLFFLEVDMGTETLAGENQNSNNILQKVINYQALFLSKGYKRYEPIFKADLNGFRLLFITTTHSRMVSICRFIQDIPPSNFIWVTDQKRMFSKGLSAAIWTCGDKTDAPRQSILGPKHACESPLIDTIK